MNAITRIEARSADLGEGMLVRRFLPSRQQRMVGAWCFLDHAGPVDFARGKGMHVGAHPHIGLQTFTWLIAGEVLHRDSLGNAQVIRPGQVNLMTAGRGIVHTEDSVRDGEHLHAAQLWIALPPEAETCAPDFAHHPDLPCWQDNGARLTLLAGTHDGRTAPTRLYSPLLGLDIASDDATALRFKVKYQGCADVGVCYPPHTKTVTVALPAGAGGDPLAALGGARGPDLFGDTDPARAAVARDHADDRCGVVPDRVLHDRLGIRGTRALCRGRP